MTRRTRMSETYRFVDVGDAAPREQHPWPSIIVPRRGDRRRDRAAGDRRAAVHRPPLHRHLPSANTAEVPAFAPGIDVTIDVVKPGEERRRSRAARPWSTCASAARASLDRRHAFAVDRFDVWNTPSMEPVQLPQHGHGPVRAAVLLQRTAAREARGARRRDRTEDDEGSADSRRGLAGARATSPSRSISAAKAPGCSATST